MNTAEVKSWGCCQSNISWTLYQSLPMHHMQSIFQLVNWSYIYVFCLQAQFLQIIDSNVLLTLFKHLNLPHWGPEQLVHFYYDLLSAHCQSVKMCSGHILCIRNFVTDLQSHVWKDRDAQ